MMHELKKLLKNVSVTTKITTSILDTVVLIEAKGCLQQLVNNKQVT